MSGITVGADGAFNMTNVPEEMRAAMGASLAQIERERRAAGKPEYSRDRGSSLLWRPALYQLSYTPIYRVTL